MAKQLGEPSRTVGQSKEPEARSKHGTDTENQPLIQWVHVFDDKYSPFAHNQQPDGMLEGWFVVAGVADLCGLGT